MHFLFPVIKIAKDYIRNSIQQISTIGTESLEFDRTSSDHPPQLQPRARQGCLSEQKTRKQKNRGRNWNLQWKPIGACVSENPEKLHAFLAFP